MEWSKEELVFEWREGRMKRLDWLSWNLHGANASIIRVLLASIGIPWFRVAWGVVEEKSR
jgi:uncharacterized iron-regulated membrane protein